MKSDSRGISELEDFARLEEALDLGFGGFDGVGGVADVAHLGLGVLEAEVTADRAGRSLGGIGRSEEVAHAGDHVLTFESEGDHRSLLHESADGWEERLVGDVRVVLGENLVGQREHLDTPDHKTFRLEPSQNLAGEIFLNRVRFEQNKRRFESHAAK